MEQLKLQWSVCCVM